jgi:hypothetical protein
MIVSLRGLAKALRRTPVAPASVATLLERQEAMLAFRRIVWEIFPEAATEIWTARADGGNRENARVWAFLRRVETEWFPVWECDEYEQVVCAIPIARNSWGYERFHALDMPPGELLLFVLCAYPYDDDGLRLPALDAAEARIPHETLQDVPPGGFTPADLRERLSETPCAGAIDFADWLWGQTGTVFLDVDEEVEIVDAECSREIVQDLAAQWQRAKAILDRIGHLTAWLEVDPPNHFAQLLDAALGRDPHGAYLRERRHYDLEITERGLTAIRHDDPSEAGPVALPVGAAS